MFNLRWDVNVEFICWERIVVFVAILDSFHSNYVRQISDIDCLLRIEIDQPERVHRQNTCGKRKKLNICLEAS